MLKVVDLENEFFLVRFSHKDDLEFVMHRDPSLILDHYLTIRRWTLNFDTLVANRNKMVLWSYPPTGRQLAITTGFFLTGVSLFAVGAHLSLANIAPQQARVKARGDFIKDRLRKLLDD
ncbi:Bric-a-brac 1 [Quillaja saponaria]|uniref:Bric-a-brac 1 n=1 Tax=Quillaja saponaria TaxID=32244 RepID=A0AAD7VHN3_QUISA|nr:Bric-a-brac 1 [Quillaja saponaria]